MLILTHRINDKTRLTVPDGRHVYVVVTEIAGGKVRVGIDAPADVTIERKDLWLGHKRAEK